MTVVKKPGRAALAGAEPRSEPFARPLGRALLFVHLAASPLVFSPQTVEVFEYNKVAILVLTAIWLLAGTGAVALVRLIRGDETEEPLAPRLRRLIREPIALGMILFWVSSLCSTITSINVRTSFYGCHESFAGIITMTAYLVQFLATRELCSDARGFRVLLFATVIAVAGSSLYGVMQLTGLDPIHWGRTSGFAGITRVFATMGHPNFLSGFLVSGFPIALYFAVRAFRERLWLVGGACAVTALLLCEGNIIISISRGAWGAFALVVAVIGAGAAVLTLPRAAVGASFFYRALRVLRRAAWGSCVAFAVALVPLALAAAALTTFPAGRAVLSSMGQRWTMVADVSAVTHESRSYIWRSAWHMFQARPLFGQGLDAFQLGFEQFRTVAYWNSEWNGTPTKAHCEPMHILATQGLVGAVSVAIISVGIVIAFIRALRRGIPDRFLLLAVLAGVVGFYAQDLVSFTVAGCGTLFVTLAACLSRLGEPSEQVAAAAAPRRSRAPAVSLERNLLALGAVMTMAILAIAAMFIVVVDPFRANAYCRLGAQWIQQNYPAQAREFLRKAVEIDGSKELYWVRLGTANQLAARSATDVDTRHRLLKEAREAYERSIELVAINSYDQANLGRLLGDMAKEQPPVPGPDGRPVTVLDAYREFDKALALDPNNAYFYADAANTALAFGDRARASDYASRCLTLYPTFGPPRSQLGYLALLEAQQLTQSAEGMRRRAEMLAREETRARVEKREADAARLATETAQVLREAERIAGTDARVKFAKAAELLGASLEGDWHGDESGRAIAASNLSAALIRTGQFERAAAAANQSLARMPDYVDARFNLAKSLEMLGDMRGAHDAYLTVASQKPEHELALRSLKELRERMEHLHVPLPPLPPNIQKALGDLPPQR